MIVLTARNWHRITKVASNLAFLNKETIQQVVERNLGSTKGMNRNQIMIASSNMIHTLDQQGLWDFSLQRWSPEFNVGWAALPISEYMASIGDTFEKSEQFAHWQSLITGYKH